MPAEPKILWTPSFEMNVALRHACTIDAQKHGKAYQPLGPFIEGLLAKSTVVQKAARAAGVKLPRRIPDARGRYDRN